jgi:imidazolonepropionase-like amidohydrolase
VPDAFGASLLIHNAILVSGKEPKPAPDSWVRIEKGEIVGVGRGRPEGKAQRMIDADGRYLIPGLIDSHVHLYHATGLKRKYAADYESLRRNFMQQQPRSFLYYGFTTVVELNADEDTNHLFTNSPLHPRLFHCGQGVILSDGFMALDVPAGQLDQEYPGYLVDHFAKGLSEDEIDTAHTPEAVVNTVLQAGGRCVKIYYEEALWWPGKRPDFSLPSVAIIRELVAFAHAKGLPVLLHATTPNGHRFGLEVGVDILAHGMWEWPGQPFDAPVPNAEYLEIAEAQSGSKIWLQPTFTTIRNTASLFDPRVLEDAGWEHVVSPLYLAYLRTEAQKQRDDFLQMFATSFPEGATESDIPALQQAFQDRYSNLVVGMIRNGSRMLFGTDTAVGGFGWAAPPGLAGYREIRHWVEAGVPLETMFEALTINNAIALGLADEIGVIKPGRRADLLLLRENPLATADAYDTIDIVIVDGTVLERGHLAYDSSSVGR